jgi:hypothetical protein
MKREYEHTETKKHKLQISPFTLKIRVKLKGYLILLFYTLHIFFYDF